MTSIIGVNFVYIENNTIVGNVGYGFVGAPGGLLSNNIIWDRTAFAGLLVVLCNDFLNIEDAGALGSANFSEDPQFCGAGAENYFLQGDSPCVAGQSPLGANCGLVGALPVNCGTTPVEGKTWGAIKSLYGMNRPGFSGDRVT